MKGVKKDDNLFVRGIENDNFNITNKPNHFFDIVSRKEDLGEINNVDKNSNCVSFTYLGKLKENNYNEDFPDNLKPQNKFICNSNTIYKFTSKIKEGIKEFDSQESEESLTPINY